MPAVLQTQAIISKVLVIVKIYLIVVAHGKSKKCVLFLCMYGSVNKKHTFSRTIIHCLRFGTVILKSQSKSFRYELERKSMILSHENAIFICTTNALIPQNIEINNFLLNY